MERVKFYLKDKGSKTKSAIYVSFYYNGKKLNASAGLSIEVHKWNLNKNWPKIQIENYTYYEAYLKRVRGWVEECYLTEKAKGTIPSPAVIKAYLKKNIDGDQGEKGVNPQAEFLMRVEEYIRVKASEYKPNSIKIYRQVLDDVKAFCKESRIELTFDTINLSFWDRYKTRLLTRENTNSNCKTKVGFLNDTIAKRASNIKTFMKWAYERNYHSNLEYQKIKYKKNKKNDIVTLTSEEIQAIIELDLSDDKRLDRVRDLFLFGIFTCQRWSDIANFDPNDIRGETWVFTAVKTKKVTVIPLKGFSEPALLILKKYDYQLPKISSVKFNEYLKDLGEKAGINNEVEINRLQGNNIIKLREPKYKFMASHMARRTGTTLLLQGGMAPTTLMKMTGHSDLATLMKYENTSHEALEEALRKTKII